MRKRKPYPSDLRDTEWHVLEPLVPQVKPGGRPEKYPRRKLLNGIRYVLRTGCSWRSVPHDLPEWRSVYYYFRLWKKDGTWQRIHDRLRGDLRESMSRHRQASAGILDSQSVKTTEKRGIRGYDAGKQAKGRKRYILVDTLGLLLMVVVHSAAIQDRDGANPVLQPLKHMFWRLRLLWADGGYTGRLLEWTRHLRPRCKLVLAIVKRSDSEKTFRVLPRRWVVERAFA